MPCPQLVPVETEPDYDKLKRKVKVGSIERDMQASRKIASADHYHYEPTKMMPISEDLINPSVFPMAITGELKVDLGTSGAHYSFYIGEFPRAARNRERSTRCIGRVCILLGTGIPTLSVFLPRPAVIRPESTP